MNRYLLYPDFIDKTPSRLLLPVVEKFRESYVGAVKQIIVITLRYVIPRLCAFPCLIFTPLIRKFRFVALNLDHFGPLAYLHHFVCGAEYSEDKVYVVLQYVDKINNHYIEAFPCNVRFIKNPIIWIVLSGFFFARSVSHHVVPESDDNLSMLRRKFKFGILDKERFYSGRRPIKPIVLSPSATKRFDLLSSGKEYIVIYCRQPGYEYSAGESARNLDFNVFGALIADLAVRGIKVVRYGFPYMGASRLSNSHDFLDYVNYQGRSGELDIAVIKNAKAIIGSATGGVTVPSVFFSRPTLYLSRVPISHMIMGVDGVIFGGGALLRGFEYGYRLNRNVIKNQKRLFEDIGQFSTLAYLNERLVFDEHTPDTVRILSLRFLSKIGLISPEILASRDMPISFNPSARHGNNSIEVAFQRSNLGSVHFA